jgi:hypothetical protein
MIPERLLDKNLHSNLMISGSLTAYFLLTFFLFLFTRYIFTTTNVDTSRLFWSFHNFANIGKNIGLAIGLYLTGKRNVYITLEQLEKIGREKHKKMVERSSGKSSY